MVYVLFVVGFFFLIKWANVFVDGASSLAKRFSLSDIVIGLTIVAFGTSAPELVVNIISSAAWNSWLALGNILWSNIANVALILWISAIIYPLKLTKRTVFLQIPFSVLAVVLLGMMINDWFTDWFATSVLTRIDWLVLLLFFAFFMWYIFHIAKKKEDLPMDVNIEKMSLMKSLVCIGLWLLGLTVWWKWIVDGAVAIAQYFGVAQSVVGLTIVALWTSLPELATSIVAVMKKKSDIAIGNVVGSNIFNILWVLGLSAIIHPIAGTWDTNRDVFFTLLVSAILFVFVLIGKKFVLQRYQWWIMVLLYLLYMGIVIWSAF